MIGSLERLSNSGSGCNRLCAIQPSKKNRLMKRTYKIRESRIAGSSSSAPTLPTTLGPSKWCFPWLRLPNYFARDSRNSSKATAADDHG